MQPSRSTNNSTQSGRKSTGITLRIPKRPLVTVNRECDSVLNPKLQITIHLGSLDKNIIDLNGGLPEQAANVGSPDTSADMFSDSLDASQLDLIIRQSHEAPATGPARTEVELSRGRPTISKATDKGKFEVTLCMPRLKSLFNKNSDNNIYSDNEPTSGTSRFLSERFAKTLIVGVNLLLENTKLPKGEKRTLQRLHKCLGEQVPTMPDEKLFLFVNKLQHYLVQLRKVIREVGRGGNTSRPMLGNAVCEQSKEPSESARSVQPLQPSPAMFYPSPENTEQTQNLHFLEHTPELAIEVQQHAPVQITPTLFGPSVGPLLTQTPSKTPAKGLVASMQSPASNPLKSPTKPKKAKRKPRKRTKPKLPYARYHFPIPVDDSTTFSSLADNGDEDDDLVEESTVMSLLDPISGSRLVTPLRTRFCSHLECFDMSSFLAMHGLRAFKVGIRRERPLASGKPNVAAIFRDTKRRPLNPNMHNKRTLEFDYKSKYRANREKGSYNNNLEFFCCPICRLEFSIKIPGDLYVVGDLVDLLFNLEQTCNADADRIAVSKDGDWHPIKEEPEVIKEKDGEVVEIDLDEESEEGDSQPIVKQEAVAEGRANIDEEADGAGVEVVSSDFDDSWNEEFRELDEILDSSVGPDSSSVPSAGPVSAPPVMLVPAAVASALSRASHELNASVGIPPLPPPPESHPGIAEMLSQEKRQRFLEHAYMSQPEYPSAETVAAELRSQLVANNRNGFGVFRGAGQQPNKEFRRYISYTAPASDRQRSQPVFFTGNGVEEDPFVID
ncbi:DEKNAAC101376 [Brettanomyces naardenensis]|uniref:DEKNAAC101376 n=1 Tax=Brettanomyces naardenensis TaxID=13370 RepID=A0A448YHN3_BRENA|nr:DEKNAAC101376 [Brettanomyces naardenensis]